ncbi:MAG TPA: hypothetical protein VK589_16155 [Chryseolinea sp.]|nr:hypothetical protein [Chryseolinea sp.]
MDSAIDKISLSAEGRGDYSLDYSDLYSDVIVRFSNGDSYVATFFSVRNLEGMVVESRSAIARQEEPFYKILNAVLVDNLQKSKLLPVIEHMIVEGDFQVVFRKI